MKTMKSQSFFCLVALGVLALISRAYPAVDSTAGNSGFQYLDVPPSPRQIAMGWTGTALGENGFAYYNPASPAIDKTSFLSVGYAPMPGDYSIAHAQGLCMISSFFIGASITNHVVSGIYPTDFNKDPDYNTPFSYDGTQLSVNAGYISNRLGIGLTLNGLQEQIGTSAAYGISASLGLVYALSRTITIGAAGLHLGTSTGFTDDTKKFGQGYALPRSGRAGIAWCDTLFRLPFTATGDIVYRDVGLRGTPLSSRLNRVSVPLGLEVRPTSYVAVRLGKRFFDDAELMTFGAGLHWSMLTFDFAIALATLVSDVQVEPFFSLSYALESPKVKTPPAATKITIEKPLEIKSVPAPAAKPSPAADTVAVQPPQTSPIAPAEKTPVPAAVPNDNAVPQNNAAPKPSVVVPQDSTAPGKQ
jgi:hypothetical protein